MYTYIATHHLAEKLVRELKIGSREDLFRKLKLKKDQVELLLLWMGYEKGYSQNDGYEEGQKCLRLAFRDMLGISIDKDTNDY